MALSSFLDTDPQAAFSMATQRLSPQMGRFFMPRYNDIYNRYRSGLAANPAMTFGSFLEKFPWLREYQSYAPYQRGFRPATMAPMTRFLNY